MGGLVGLAGVVYTGWWVWKVYRSTSAWERDLVVGQTKDRIRRR